MKKMKSTLSLLIAITMITGVFAGFNITASAKAKAAKTVEITWWNYPNYQVVDNTPGKYEKDLIAKFNKKYPNIKVNVEMIDFVSGPQKLSAAIASNSAPDLVYDYPGRIIDYARNGVMAPLDSMFTKAFLKDVPKKITDACKVNGKYYMYPINTAPFMMSFNKTLLDKYGLTKLLPLNRPDRSWTTDEFFSLLRQIKAKVPGLAAPMAIYCKASGGDQGTRPLIANMGGSQIISADLSQYLLNRGQNPAALQKIVNAVKEGIILKGAEALTSNDVIDMYLQQKIACTPLYSVVLKKTSAVKKSSNFEEVFVAYPTSNLKQKPFLEAFVGGIGVFDNGDAAKIDAAKKLTDFIVNDKSVAKANLISTGGFSVRTSQKGLYADKESKFAESMVQYLGTYYNAVPGFAEMRTYYFPMLQQVLLGQVTPKKGLDDFVKKANVTLKNK
jgi:multiple sugar transport system substrate-binding protein